LIEHVHRVEKKMRCAQRVASQVENDLRLSAARRIEHARELGRQQLHPGHQPDGTRHLAEELRRLIALTRVHRVGQHQHLARVHALGTGGNAFTASIAGVRECGRDAGQRRAMGEKVDHSVRDSFGIGILEAGVRNDRAYFDALATRSAGAEHLGGFGIEVVRE
jgi:hypothetical protein